MVDHGVRRQVVRVGATWQSANDVRRALAQAAEEGTGHAGVAEGRVGHAGDDGEPESFDELIPFRCVWWRQLQGHAGA